MSCSRRSSRAASNGGASRGTALNGLLLAYVCASGPRCVCEDARMCRWIMGKARCEGMSRCSARSRTARAAPMLSCSVESSEGVPRKMLMPSDAETAGGALARRRRRRRMCR
jgi:hypothetical protein